MFKYYENPKFQVCNETENQVEVYDGVQKEYRVKITKPSKFSV